MKKLDDEEPERVPLLDVVKVILWTIPLEETELKAGELKKLNEDDPTVVARPDEILDRVTLVEAPEAAAAKIA